MCKFVSCCPHCRYGISIRATGVTNWHALFECPSHCLPSRDQPQGNVYPGESACPCLCVLGAVSPPYYIFCVMISTQSYCFHSLCISHLRSVGKSIAYFFSLNIYVVNDYHHTHHCREIRLFFTLMSPNECVWIVHH